LSIQESKATKRDEIAFKSIVGWTDKKRPPVGRAFEMKTKSV